MPVNALPSEVKAVLAAMKPRPIAEWREDMGPVLWWRFPITEPPYVGTPLDLGFVVEAHTTTRVITHADQDHDPTTRIERISVGGWPGYHTHFTPIVCPKEPTP